MTSLLTDCPFCESNFMLLDTRTKKGVCVICNKSKELDDNEIAAAEARRDSLSEKYMGRFEKAFSEKDYPKLAELTKEVLEEGISSWYAWTCMGCSDLHDKKFSNAMQDFSIAILFLDEENFDEFYEILMDAIIDSLLESAGADEPWGDSDASLVDLTGTLFERFEHLCDYDLITDLMLRLSAMAADIESGVTCVNLMKEIVSISMDYLSANIFIADRQDMLNYAVAAIEELDAMVGILHDENLNPTQAEMIGPGFVEFLNMINAKESEIMSAYSEDQLLTFCDYWAENDYSEIFNLMDLAFESHLGAMTSNGRNKGMVKKRDKALEDFYREFTKPLKEGLVDEYKDYIEYDKICPDCGKYLIADDNGLMVCECGFRSRVVTKSILDLPENVPELIALGKEALNESDPAKLNNIGERILEFDHDCWLGYAFLAESCLMDGEIPESVMLFGQAADALKEEDADEFSEMIVMDLGRTLGNLDTPDKQFVFVFLPSFLDFLAESPAKDRDIPMRMLDVVCEQDIKDADSAIGALLSIIAIFHFCLGRLTDLNDINDLCHTVLDRLKIVQDAISSVKRDPNNVKAECDSSVKTYTDLIEYLSNGIEIRSLDTDISSVSDYWKGHMDEYNAMIGDLISAIISDGKKYSKNSKEIQKSKHAIDSFLDSYMKAGKE